MKVKKLEQPISCHGISVRTTNKAETDFKTVKLGELWQTFYQNYLPNLDKGAQIYGIYHHYQSGDSGEFDVVASWQDGTYQNDVTDANDKPVSVTIPAGKYLLFSEKGNMPDIVMDTWEKVWEYFSDPACEYTRTYDVDFEQYIDGSLEYGQVDIYIGVA